MIERAAHPELRVRAFVSASGSAGTLAAGDTLKEQHGSVTVAVEALECPTLLRNGFGEHNIQGIGDKHIPYIHNVMSTDIVTGVSDRSTDALDVLFNTDEGRLELARRGVADDVVDSLRHLGLSSICNLVASIKVAKRLGLGEGDLVLSVATDGAALYGSERAKTTARLWPDGFDSRAAAAVFAEHLAGISDDHLLECATEDRNRIFNLGYFTWVEQQGVAARRLRGPAVAVVLDRPARPRAEVGRRDRRVQRPDGRAQFVVISCAGCGWPASPRSNTPFRCPRSGRPGDDVDHVLVRRLPAGARWPAGGERNPFLRYRTLLSAYDRAARRLPARRRRRATR